MPSAIASARWPASKLVTPIAPISPSSRRRCISCRASSQAGCSKVHQWNCKQIDLVDAEPGKPLLDAATHDVGRHRPRLRAPFGEGERPVRRRHSAPAAGRRSARRCRSGRPCRTCRSRRAHRPAARRRRVRDRSSSPFFSMSATCHSPQTRRLIERPGAMRCVQALRHGMLLGVCLRRRAWRRRCAPPAEVARHDAPRPECRAGAAAGSRTAPTPIMTICSAAARACCSGGNERRDRGGRSAQMPQTSTAPRIAPRLLPEPPTISIAQTWKVRIGR